MLANLSAVLMCASNDVHTVHFYIRGKGFDTIHVQVTNDMYAKLADDADNVGEYALAMGEIVPNFNMAATIIEWDSVKPQEMNYDEAILQLDSILGTVVAMCNAEMQQLTDEGAKNLVAGLCEYYTKQQLFFNRARADLVQPEVNQGVPTNAL